MRVVVCLKPVPDPRSWNRLPVDPVRGTPPRAGIPLTLSPVDRTALDLGLDLARRNQGTAVALGMGPPGGEQALRQALALGAHEAVLVSDALFAGADTLLTSQVLATAVGRIGPVEIVLCGAESPDAGTGSVPAQLAALLGQPLLTGVVGITNDGAQVEARCVVRGEECCFRLPAPVVAAVPAGSAAPRPIPLTGVLAARSRPLAIWDAHQLGWGPEANSYTEMVGWGAIEAETRARFLEGAPEEAAASLAREMAARGLVVRRGVTGGAGLP